MIQFCSPAIMENVSSKLCTPPQIKIPNLSELGLKWQRNSGVSLLCELPQECLPFVSGPRSVSPLWATQGASLLCEHPQECFTFVSDPSSVSPLQASPGVPLLWEWPQECLSFVSTPRSLSFVSDPSCVSPVRYASIQPWMVSNIPHYICKTAECKFDCSVFHHVWNSDLYCWWFRERYKLIFRRRRQK